MEKETKSAAAAVNNKSLRMKNHALVWMATFFVLSTSFPIAFEMQINIQFNVLWQTFIQQRSLSIPMWFVCLIWICFLWRLALCGLSPVYTHLYINLVL